MFAAFMAACCAANGVPLRDPRKPSEPELFHESTFPAGSAMVTIVLLNEAWMCAMPCDTCLRSFFLNVFFLPFFSGAAAPPAAAGFAIMSFVLGRSSFVVGLKVNRCCERPTTEDQRRLYVFAAAFFLIATVPLRGPFLVRALVWVRWPRTGRLRRWRKPR